MGTGRYGSKHSSKLGGLSSKTTKDVTSRVLGKRVRPLFERYNTTTALGIVNPNYNMPGTGSAYTENCALCVSAAALQLMGYDVEAMPRDKKWRGFDSVFDYQWTPDNFKSPANKGINYTGVPWTENYINTNRFTGSDAASVAREIEAQMKSWGPNSFASMNVAWNGGGAHTIIVYQSANGTAIMDFQIHKTYTVDQWFKAHPSAKADSVGLYRLDNQTIKFDTRTIHKIVKRRGE